MVWDNMNDFPKTLYNIMIKQNIHIISRMLKINPRYTDANKLFKKLKLTYFPR